jgi:hypothetical protein
VSSKSKLYQQLNLVSEVIDLSFLFDLPSIWNPSYTRETLSENDRSLIHTIVRNSHLSASDHIFTEKEAFDIQCKTNVALFSAFSALKKPITDEGTLKTKIVTALETNFNVDGRVYNFSQVNNLSLKRTQTMLGLARKITITAVIILGAMLVIQDWKIYNFGPLAETFGLTRVFSNKLNFHSAIFTGLILSHAFRGLDAYSKTFEFTDINVRNTLSLEPLRSVANIGYYSYQLLGTNRRVIHWLTPCVKLFDIYADVSV